MQNLQERIENAARAILRAGGAITITSDSNWPNLVRHHQEMCERYPHYEGGSSTSVVEAFRAAKVVLAAEFGDEEPPRYTTRRMREEIRTEEERGRQYEREAVISAAEPVAWYWEDSTGCFHMTLDRPDVVEMAKSVGCVPKPLYTLSVETSRFFDQPPLESEGAQAIVAERKRQIQGEGWTTDSDDRYRANELIEAASCYALHRIGNENAVSYHAPLAWPWAPEWWKPTTPIRDLVKAGALLAAEIDRLMRVGALAKQESLR